jgi:hypothetical protein
MYFDLFLQTLPKLAAMKYPEYEMEEALLILAEKNFKSLYFKIMNDSDMGEDIKFFHAPVNKDCLKLI